MAIKIDRKKTSKEILKPRAVADLIEEIEKQKQRLILRLLNCAPASLPLYFRSHLGTVVIPKLLADGHFAGYYKINDFGFTETYRFRQQIRLLQKAWEKAVRISFMEPADSSFMGLLEFHPIH